MSHNLLVVDWDYMFYDPFTAGDTDDEHFRLFEWGHKEIDWFINSVWPSRAEPFLRNGIRLPQVDVPVDWWNRFNIAPEAICEVSDSNMYSGLWGGDTIFDHVWLYDAHHDLYRIKTEKELADWHEQGCVACSDWMFAHHIHGAKLHWRWPQWQKQGEIMRQEIPKWVNCDARKDDMGFLDVRFHAVSICRSGAWVPPWCDDKFAEFYNSCPAAEIVQVDDVELVREWDESVVRQFLT